MKNTGRILFAALVLAVVVGCALTVTAHYVCRGRRDVPSVESDPSPQDRSAIEKVVKESQMYETLLYTHPDDFTEQNLAQYWIPDAPDILDRTDWHIIKQGIAHLRQDGQHYGEEIKDAQGKIVQRGTENEEFVIRQIKLTSSGYAAYVETEEKWYCPLHDRNHNLIGIIQEHKGPYTLHYSLVKLNGAWFIVKGSTPRRQSESCNWPLMIVIGAVSIFAGILTIYFFPFYARATKRELRG